MKKTDNQQEKKRSKFQLQMQHKVKKGKTSNKFAFFALLFYWA